MKEITVKVFRDGRFLKTIDRPVRMVDGRIHVTYRKKLRPVVHGNEIHIGRAPTTLDQGQADVPDWDPSQEWVIKMPIGDRLLVDAGPGTGKTAVACARVAHLISNGADPGHIWLISFTRTAVAELRDRIRKLSEDESRAAAVRISTLDSHTWYLREGFAPGEAERLFAGYEESIEDAIELLRGGSPEIEEYFSAVQHLIIDEAQDLVGSRAELLEVMIGLLGEQCGVTIFTDDAQAIYGFSEGRTDDPESGSPTLPARVRERPGTDFGIQRLTSVHRTSSESLRRIFTDTREVVLDRNLTSAERMARVVEGVQSAADAKVGDVTKQALDARDDTLVLFRRRAEVLMASSFLRGEGVRHRIRMSRTPVVLMPWVATLLWDQTSAYLTRNEFEALWQARLGGRTWAPDQESAWKLLERTAGDSRRGIELRRLRRSLSRSRPPVSFTSPDVGWEGPILGTIHASKGREAPRVHLMLPIDNHRANGDIDEESRVLFVGATRPRKSLSVGKGYKIFSASLDESGRAYKFGSRRKSPRAQVEIGMAADIDPSSMVSSRYASDLEEVRTTQRWLEDQVGSHQPELELRADPDHRWRYGIHVKVKEEGPGRPVGFLRKSFNGDLFSIGEALAKSRKLKKLTPGPKIRHCHLVAVSGHVVSEDDPVVDELIPPYDETRTFLVPVIAGFTNVYFNK